MGYRDDREAAMARADALEREVAELKRSLEHDRSAHRRTRNELAAAERKLARLRGEAGPPVPARRSVGVEERRRIREVVDARSGWDRAVLLLVVAGPLMVAVLLARAC